MGGVWFPTSGTYTGSTTNTLTLDVRTARSLAFSLSGLVAETVTLDTSLDGVNWTTGAMPIVVTTGTVPLTSALGNGSYQYGNGTIPCAYVRWTKSGSVNPLTIIYGVKL